MVEVNQRQMAREGGDISGEYSEKTLDSHVKMSKRKNLDIVLKSEILELVSKQDRLLGNQETALGFLERRLRILDSEKLSGSPKKKSITGIEDRFKNEGQNSQQKDFIENYNSIYVSPIYEEKKSHIKYRSNAAEDSDEVRNKASNRRMKDDEKDLEIRRLKAELQRLRLQDIEEERNTVADKFIDKINTIRTSPISRVFEAHQSMGTNFSGSPTENFCRQEDRNGFKDRHCDTMIRNSGPSIMKDGHVAGGGLSLVPHFDRPSQAADSSKNNYELQKTVNLFLITMQDSVENLWNSFKTCDSRDCDSYNINTGAVEDELFILKKTLCKLAEVWQESGYRYSQCDDGRGLSEMRDVQGTEHGIMQPLSQTDCKMTEKDRKIEDYERKIQAILHETEAIMTERLELTTAIQEMHKEAEEQRHRIEELLSINEELLNFSQVKEDQLILLNMEAHNLHRQIENFPQGDQRLQELAGQHSVSKTKNQKQKQKLKALRHKNNFLRLNLAGAESKYIQKEEALDRIPYGEQKVGEHPTQTQIYMDELEEKLLFMDAEFSKAMKQIRAMRVIAC